MTYEIIMINGRIVCFGADEVRDYGESYAFYVDDEIVGEFKKNNIAGYIQVRRYDDTSCEG